MSNKSLTALIVGVVLAIVLWNSFTSFPRPSAPCCCASAGSSSLT